MGSQLLLTIASKEGWELKKIAGDDFIVIVGEEINTAPMSIQRDLIKLCQELQKRKDKLAAIRYCHVGTL
jgi:hypothetical protein